MSEKILIVDDDASFRRVIDYTLKEEGHETLWPGNARELENLMERLAALNEDGVISVDELPDFVLSQASRVHRVLVNIPPEGVDLEQVERDLIREALERNNWNQTHAARFLRITRNTLIYRMQKFGISLPEAVGSQPSVELTEEVNEVNF